MDKESRYWLEKNKYGIYHGHSITPETKLVRYTYVYFFIGTHYRNTRYYFKEFEKSKAQKAKIVCIVITLLFGWWQIPFQTIGSISKNTSNIANRDQVLWGEIASEQMEGTME